MRFKKKLLLSLKSSSFSNIALLVSIFILSLAVFCGGYLYQVYLSCYNNMISADGFSMGVESQNGISDSVLKELLNINEVIGYNNAAMQTVSCTPVDFKNVAYESKEKEENTMISSLPETKEVVLCGNLDTKWNRLFVNGSLKLIQGTWPKTGTSEVLLDEKLCQKNKLHLGDSISVIGENQETEYTFILTGIYSTITAPSETVYINGESCELATGSSYIFCDAEIWESISGSPIANQLIDVYTDSEKNLEILLKKTSKILETDYTIYNNVENRIQDHYTLLYTLRLFSNGSFLLIGILSIVILGLQLIYWMQGQYIDAGIYLALGMKESAIKCLLNAKIVLISGIALTASTITSLLIEHYGKNTMNKIIFSLPMIPNWEEYSINFSIENGLWIIKNNIFYMLFFIILVNIVLHFLFKNSVKKLLK
jgi:hypothetical protein